MGGIFGKPDPIKLPTPPPVTRLAQVGDPAMEKQRLRLADKRRGRRGREASFLSDVTSAKSGGVRGGSKLGVA